MARKTFGRTDLGDEMTLYPNGKTGDEYPDKGSESFKSNEGKAAPKPEQQPTFDKKKGGR